MIIRFRNRNDAAQRLLPYLGKYAKEQSVVLAVPRGGVPIGYPIAKSFNLPLELLMTKKIGHPAYEEFAIGAVSLEDHIIDDQHGVPQSYIDSEVNRIKDSLKERYNYFMSDHKPVSLKGKIVIIVDDGVATGNTILSSIKMLRRKDPEKIVVAVPVSSKQAAEKIKQQVDDFICLYMPEPFIGVGMHYTDFSQVSDEEVVQLLKDANHFEDAA
jgi:putative phosphoribosyl transferase